MAQPSFIPGARDVQIVGSTLSVVGGDVHNHNYHYERPKGIWAILQAIPNLRKIYLDMLSKATSGTGRWLIRRDTFGVWLEPNGDIKIFWGSGIREWSVGLLGTLLTCTYSRRRQKPPRVSASLLERTIG
jgi:hypothetical protein